MTFVDIEAKQPPPEIIGACFLYKDSCIVKETFNINAILSKTVASSLAVSSSQDDHNWYHARRSDGKVGMFPGNYVKERRQNNGESVNAPQLLSRTQQEWRASQIRTKLQQPNQPMEETWNCLICKYEPAGHFKNTYELLNLRALKFSPVNKI